MKIRQIKVDSIHDSLAGIIINIFENKKSGPTTNQLVLSKLIQYAEGCEIHDAIEASADIAKELNISDSKFRKAFFNLSKLGIVTRDKSIITINPAARSEFDAILLIDNNTKTK